MSLDILLLLRLLPDLFTQGYMLIYHGSSVPAGWLVALNYIRNGAHVKLIVPSKMGQSDAMRDVHPYYYDLHNSKFGTNR
mgnify:CR=1 FL=1